MTPAAPPHTIFYVAPVAVGSGHGLAGIPAVRNKVLGVLAALRAAGARPILVSTVGDPRAVHLARPLRAGNAGGFDAVQVFAPGRAAVRRLVASLSLLVAAIRLVRGGDRVILYNFFPEYLPAALWLAVCGIPCVLDIEDAPRADDRGFGALVNRISFRLLRFVTQRRYLIVSDQLARSLGLSRYLTVYGVASHFSAARPGTVPFGGDAVRINYGGAMLHETGIDLFAAALRILVREHDTAPLHVFVTGHVPHGQFDALLAEVNASPAVRLTVAADLDGAAYRALLETMDAGLCLKLPSTAMGQTTFPSKVIEIAAKGLLLVTTAVSDVPLIFDDSCAVVLAGEDPVELATALATLTMERSTAADRARRGQQRVAERFSAEAVGTAIRRFLDA